MRLIIGFVIVSLATGCGPKPPQTQHQPQKSAQKEEECDEEEPSHQAPPPSYGNKIVLLNKEVSRQ